MDVVGENRGRKGRKMPNYATKLDFSRGLVSHFCYKLIEK